MSSVRAETRISGGLPYELIFATFVLSSMLGTYIHQVCIRICIICEYVVYVYVVYVCMLYIHTTSVNFMQYTHLKYNTITYYALYYTMLVVCQRVRPGLFLSTSAHRSSGGLRLGVSIYYTIYYTMLNYSVLYCILMCIFVSNNRCVYIV